MVVTFGLIRVWESFSYVSWRPRRVDVGSEDVVVRRIALVPAIGCLTIGLLLVSCDSSSTAEEDGTTSVVASFYPLEEAASQVGGDLVTVENLTPPGVEPHDLELAPDDIETIATADVVLYLGGGFQPAVEDAIAEAADAVIVDALEAVDTVPAPPSEAEEGLTVDPHVWLDPARFEQVVRAVAGALSDADPANEATFRSSAETYAAELALLDDEFRTGLSDCERTTIVTSHEAFGYLADAYGLTEVAISGLSPEAEPDAKRLAELRDLVEEEGVTTIFAEELVSPDVAETLADEAGVTVDVLDPLESLTDKQVEAGEDYVSVMRGNLDRLRAALDCV
jgi:zinc transport system substrate-binding protein